MKLRTLELNYHYDAAHGWIECPMALLYRLNIRKWISRFSYQNIDRTAAYLEEDSDAGKLIDALKAAGIEVTLIEKEAERLPNGETRIRCMAPFSRV